MSFPIPQHTSQIPEPPPAIVRTVGREDVLWDRPVFKAPPLRWDPSQLDAQKLADDLREIALGVR